MTFGLFTIYLATTAMSPAHSDPSDLLAGTFTNEEQAYFEKDAGREAPPWISLRIEGKDNGFTLSETDAFGTETSAGQSISVEAGKQHDIITVGNCSRFFDRSESGWTYSQVQNKKSCGQSYQITAISQDGLTLRFSNGTETVLKRARPVECWAAVMKSEPKEDGSPDWLFAQKLTLHDQGGRAVVGGGDSGADPVTLRMRSVHWPAPSTNRPSLVLYIHKEDPDRAESYNWADIDASRIGTNLRWMQASCTVSGAERNSEVNAENFRG